MIPRFHAVQYLRREDLMKCMRAAPGHAGTAARKRPLMEKKGEITRIHAVQKNGEGRGWQWWKVEKGLKFIDADGRQRLLFKRSRAHHCITRDMKKGEQQSPR